MCGCLAETSCCLWGVDLIAGPSLFSSASSNLLIVPLFALCSYRLAPDEYEVRGVGPHLVCRHAHLFSLQILASAAAIATVALTTAKSGTEREEASSFSSGLLLDNIFAGSQGRSSRALSLEEQDEITSTLRAWVRRMARHAEHVLTHQHYIPSCRTGWSRGR